MRRKRSEERFFLYPHEVEDLIMAGKKIPQRNVVEQGIRNQALLLMMAYHGLRVCEARTMRWKDVDFKIAQLTVRRVKGSNDGQHPLFERELRLLGRLRKIVTDSPYLFLSRDGHPLSQRAAQYIVEAAAKLTDIPIKVHAHMLRHSCGYKIMNEDNMGLRECQIYLGHECQSNTAIYAHLNPNVFRNLWR